MRMIRLIGFVLVLVSLASCERYELELYYSGKAKVHVDVDWITRFGEYPSGMTIMLAKDGDAITYSDITNDVDGYDMELEPGEYKMLIFNRTLGEFGSMGFSQMKSFDQAYAYAQRQERTTDFWDVNVSYMREPEHIGCAVDTFTILPEMVDDMTRFVNWKDKVDKESQTLYIQEVVEPMTTEMYIRVRVIGAKYMSSVIGSISGMADGFLLTQAWRRTQLGYHLLDNWSRSAITYEDGDTLKKSIGYISTTIRTFGLPHGRELDEQRDSTSNTLSLCFTLLDEKRLVFRYPVGKMIKYRRKDEDKTRADEGTGKTGEGTYFSKADVTLELDLIVDAPFYDDDEVPNLPYAQPVGTGAFDAEVDPWGDDEIIDISM